MWLLLLDVRDEKQEQQTYDREYSSVQMKEETGGLSGAS